MASGYVSAIGGSGDMFSSRTGDNNALDVLVLYESGQYRCGVGF